MAFFPTKGEMEVSSLSPFFDFRLSSISLSLSPANTGDITPRTRREEGDGTSSGRKDEGERGGGEV